MKIEASIKEFEEGLNSFLSKSVNAHQILVRQIAFNLYDAIRMETPVDTGRARAAWMIGNRITSDVPRRLTPEERKRISFHEPGTEGSGVLESDDTVPTLDNIDEIWIYNNVFYIIYLEHGSSKQAPHGMIAKSLMRFDAHMGTFRSKE